MPALVPTPAAFSHLSLCMVEQANTSLPRRNDNDGLRSAIGAFGSPNVAAMAVDFLVSVSEELVVMRQARIHACLLDG